MIDQLGGDQPREDLYQMRNPTKDPVRTAGGLKAWVSRFFSLQHLQESQADEENRATKNPRVTQGGKKRAEEKLGQMAEPSE